MNLFRNVLDRLRIIDTREVAHEWYEICATGRATYDEETHQIKVELDAFLRRIELRGPDEVLRPEWLPPGEKVSLGVSLEEASDAAGEIFDTWAKKVGKCIPVSGDWHVNAAWLDSRQAKKAWPTSGAGVATHAYSPAFN